MQVRRADANVCYEAPQLSDEQLRPKQESQGNAGSETFCPRASLAGEGRVMDGKAGDVQDGLVGTKNTNRKT